MICVYSTAFCDGHYFNNFVCNAVVPSERKNVINGLFRLNPFGLFADFVDKVSMQNKIELKTFFYHLNNCLLF